MHDVTCSIGSELMALSATPGIAGIIGSDIDPVRLAMADHNLRQSRSPTPWLLARADALSPASTADVVIADPARRNARGRTFKLDELDPPLLDLMAVYAGRARGEVRPGLDYRLLRDRFGFGGQVQVVSLDGECAKPVCGRRRRDRRSVRRSCTPTAAATR